MMIDKHLKDHHWKGVYKPVPYMTGEPDFIRVLDKFDIGDERDALTKYMTEVYDHINSKDVCVENAFQGTIRITPGIPEIVGSVDRLAPYSKSGFNTDAEFINPIAKIIKIFLKQFEAITGESWRSTTSCVSALRPGDILMPHIDGFVAHTRAEKIHIPLTSNTSCRNFNDIRLGAIRYHHLKPGEIYVINNLEPHSAFNFGESVRFHLIFDLMSNASYRELVKTHNVKPTDNIYRIVDENSTIGNTPLHKQLQLRFNKDLDKIAEFVKDDWQRSCKSS